MPPGVASPKAGSRGRARPSAGPPSARAVRGGGVDVDALMTDRSITRPPSQHRVAGDVVAAAPDREQQVMLAREGHGLDDVRHAGGADDSAGRRSIMPFQMRARRVVARVAGAQQRAAQARP